jgi:hypothetical protein
MSKNFTFKWFLNVNQLISYVRYSSEATVYDHDLCYQLLLVIKFNRAHYNYKYILIKITGYCYHLVNVTSLSLSQSDSIKASTVTQNIF